VSERAEAGERGEARDGSEAGADAITWEYRVPLLTSRFMLWDMVRVTAMSVLIMYVLVAATGWFVEGEPVLLPLAVPVLTAAVLFALFVVTGVLLGNGMTMTFRVDAEGVAYATGSRERKLSRLAVLLGVLGGSATTAGAGLLASAREQGGWTWTDIHAVRPFPAQRVISLRNSWRTVLRLHCTPENYEPVLAVVDAGVTQAAEVRAMAEQAAAVEAPDGMRRPWWSVLRAVIAPVVAGLLVAAWPWLQYGDAMRWLLVSVVLLVIAGAIRVDLGRLLALLSLGPTAYVVVQTIAEALEVSGGPDAFYGWQLDTGLLALTVLGELMLVAIALMRLLQREPEAG